MSNNDTNYSIKNKQTISAFALKGWLAIPGYILFFMMLFVPTTYQLAKGIILAICMIIISVKILFNKGKTNLHPSVLKWTGFYILLGLIFIFIGVLRGAPGALRVSTVYVLWPIVFTILITGASKLKIIQGIMRTMVIATIVIGIYSLSYILWSWGWLPNVFYIPLDLGQSIGFYKGYTEYALYNISSLIFLVPFLLAALLTWPKDQNLIGMSRKWLWFAFVLGISLVIFSGRRALILVVLVSPVVILILSRFLSPMIKSKRMRILTLLGMMLILTILFYYLSTVFAFNVNDMKDMFTEGFDFSHNTDPARSGQFEALINGWKQYPLFGAGHGAAVSYSRSDTQSWAYELSYVALLYQTGIVGLILYSLCILWIVWKGIKIIKSRCSLGLLELPILTGLICFLIANATNPYLGKFDYMWVIFLPMLLINQALLNKQIL